MNIDFTWLIGGPQGSGVESGANIFSKVCSQMGYQVFGKREFYSNIKGEHSYFTVRISDEKIHSNVNDVNLMVSFDAETIFRHFDEISSEGGIIYDSELENIDTDKVRTLDKPFKDRLHKLLESKNKPFTIAGVLELAKENENIVGVTPAMLSGSSLNKMMAEMPSRVFDVGIAEQHAVTFSAGLSTQGILPFCNIYSSFMQRAYDQVIHDVALQNLDVVFCLDRGGFVGADGATHHGAFDLAYFRCIPNMIVSAPMNESELRNLMYTAQLKNHGPFSIRYPRGSGVMTDWKTPFEEVKIGSAKKIKDGEEVAILSFGHPGNFVATAYKILPFSNHCAS